MPRWFLSRSFACLVFLAAPSFEAVASGRLVDCVKPISTQDKIPGVEFGAVRYSEYRCRFRGATTLPHDNTRKTYTYDMPAWIIAPRRLDDGNGTVVVDPFHTVQVLSERPTGAEGEMPLGLAMLGPRYLFRSGLPGGSPAPNFTWVGIRWDPDTLATPFPHARYDHLYEQRYGVSPGSISASPDRAVYVGIAMLADLADALRSGELVLHGQSKRARFANVQRVIAHGQSQTTYVLRSLLQDPPSPWNGGGRHNIPIFDGWMLSGGGGLFPQWPNIAVDGTLTIRPDVLRDQAPPPHFGKVIDLNSEQDVGPQIGGFAEYVRFAGAPAHRSYETAGGSHFDFGVVNISGANGAIFLPDIADRLAEKAAIRSVTPGFDLPMIDALDCTDEPPLLCSNPLNWQPLDRALFTALNAWVGKKTPPPPNAWLLPSSGLPNYGIGTKRFDSVGNALGGIRLPAVAIGRGRFFATAPSPPFPGGIILAGAYVDRHEAFGDHRDYVRKFAGATVPLLLKRYLLPADAYLLIREAAESRVGIPPY